MPKPVGLISSARKGGGAAFLLIGSRLGRIGMGSLAGERIFRLLEIPVGVQSGTPGIQGGGLVTLATIPAQGKHMPFPLSMGGVHPQHRMPARLTAQTAGRLASHGTGDAFLFGGSQRAHDGSLRATSAGRMISDMSILLPGSDS